MNRKLALLTALAAGLLPAAVVAQVSPAVPQPATPAPQAAPAGSVAPAPLPPPEAFPAKIALVDFQPAVFATNEGQRAVDDIQKKYLPKKAELDALGQEIEALKKQVDATPSTLTAEERTSKLKSIDTKQKLYQGKVDDAETAYKSDVQDAYDKLAPKLNQVLQSYAKQSGYTIVLDVSSQASQVMWATQTPNSDITDALIATYNASTPTITAPPPAAPMPAQAPAPAAPARPKTAPPATHTTPKPPAQ
jgi:outer membrane protein